MRIAMLGHKRVPSREGGVEIVVEELAVRMAALGHEVTCYNRRGHHVSGKEFDTEKIREYKGMQLKNVLTLNFKGFAAMSASFSAAVCAAFGKYDVVHFHAEGPCAMMWLPKLMGKRCVATIHGLDHQRSKWGRFARTYIMLGEKCAVKCADEIIVLSRSNQDYFRQVYGRETKFIPNGVSCPEHREAQEITKKYGLEKDGYLLYLGRIVPEKGAHYLIDAFRKTKTEKKLVIAGGSSDSSGYFDKIRSMAEGDDRILFTGFVQGIVLEELYSNAYLYVLPSDLEGMPLSLLEAMSYGNCCVVSDIPECADVVGEKAVTFPKQDVAALNETLQELCSRPDIVKRYKQGASEHVCRQFDWAEIVRETIEMYGERT